MGGNVAQTLFGGKSSAENQHNDAFPIIQNQLTSTLNQGTQAGSQIANMLGLNGSASQDQGFNNFRNSTGYQFGLNQGMGAITGGAATKGLLNSGGTLKALQSFGQDYASSKYGDYMSQLQNLLGSGIQGAGIMSNAGQVMNMKSSESPGMGSFIGSLMAK